MQLHALSVRAKRRKRLGRGLGSRRGTYSTRGVKGQKARAGARIRPGFEGGQTPLYARLPKRRGFRSLRPKAQAVNLADLEKLFETRSTVTREGLVAVGLLSERTRGVKILGDGTLSKSLTIRGLPVSKSARVKIEHAGGRIVDEAATEKS